MPFSDTPIMDTVFDLLIVGAAVSVVCAFGGAMAQKKPATAYQSIEQTQSESRKPSTAPTTTAIRP